MRNLPTRRRACAVGFNLLAADTPSWPARPIVFVVPQNSSGANDIVARAIAQSLRNTLGQPIVVENRPGANGNV